MSTFEGYTAQENGAFYERTEGSITKILVPSLIRVRSKDEILGFLREAVELSERRFRYRDEATLEKRYLAQALRGISEKILDAIKKPSASTKKALFEQIRMPATQETVPGYEETVQVSYGVIPTQIRELISASKIRTLFTMNPQSPNPHYCFGPHFAIDLDIIEGALPNDEALNRIRYEGEHINYNQARVLMMDGKKDAIDDLLCLIIPGVNTSEKRAGFIDISEIVKASYALNIVTILQKLSQEDPVENIKRQFEGETSLIEVPPWCT